MNHSSAHGYTDNELIAVFMGFERYDETPVTKQGIYKLKDVSLSSPYWGRYRGEQMHFNASWDWLMPVVEKISLIVYEEGVTNNGYKDVVVKNYAYPRTFAMPDSEGNFMVRFNRMTLHQDKSLIKATYEAVVEFIKWHNQQSK